LNTEFVLVDFENVQPKDLALLNGASHKIKIFLGTHQTKIPVAMARALQAFGSDVEYVQVNGNGNNALDFHIAYYIGKLAASSPNSRFHVISKDAGFDPLIKHLREQGIACGRSISVAAIAQAPAILPVSEPIAERAKAIVANLAKRKSGKPRTLKTLRSTIKALLGSQLTEHEPDQVIEYLTTEGVIKIADGKVEYDL
jgi:hypothetical protein